MTFSSYILQIICRMTSVFPYKANIYLSKLLDLNCTTYTLKGNWEYQYEILRMLSLSQRQLPQVKAEAPWVLDQ